MKCCLCKGEIEKQYHNGRMFWDSGHNAEPLKDGRCCTGCNDTKVIPARIALINEKLPFND